MENIIYNSVDVGVVEISESREGKRSKKQCEIDFVINKDSKRSSSLKHPQSLGQMMKAFCILVCMNFC